MGFDDNREAEERKRLLEEIQRRAEAAELARIEAEEARFSQILSSDELSLTSSESVETVSANPQPVALTSSHDEAEVSEQNPILKFHRTPSPPKQNTTHTKQRPADLLSSARNYYEREDYDRALDLLNEFASADPANSEVATFRRDVEKAKALSERLQEEEQRRLFEKAEIWNAPAVPSSIEQPKIIPPQKESRHEESLAETEEVAPVPPPDRTLKVRRILNYLGAFLLILLGIVTAVVVYKNVRSAYFPSSVSILVLPPTESSLEENVGRGLTNELITHLSHLRNTKVLSSNTTWQVSRTTNISPAQAGADYYLRWRVREKEGMLTATLALFDASSSAQILDQVVHGSESGGADLCAEAASAVARALGVDARDMQAAFMTASVKPAAYEKYLLGRSLETSQVPLDSVLSVFRQAQSLDETYPYIESALGWINIRMHSMVEDTAGTYLAAASENLKRSVNLGGSSAEVYRLWGAVEYLQGNTLQALQRFEHAAALASSDCETQSWLARVFLLLGKNRSALDAGKLSAEADPHGRPSQALLGTVYLANEDYGNALRTFNRMSRLDSMTHVSDLYFAALVGANQHEKALDMLRSRLEASPKDFKTLYDLGRMYQLAGKPKSDWEKTFLQSLQIIEDTLKANASYAPAYSYRALALTRLGLFSEGGKASKKALDLAPNDISVLYIAARVLALQQNRTQEAFDQLVRAVDRRYEPEYLLDLDFSLLRRNPDFSQKIASARTRR